LTRRSLIWFRRDLAWPLAFRPSGVRWPLISGKAPSWCSTISPKTCRVSLVPSTCSSLLSPTTEDGRSRCPRFKPTALIASRAFLIAPLTNRTRTSAPTSGAKCTSIRTLASGTQPWDLSWSGISLPVSMRRRNSWAAHAASSLVRTDSSPTHTTSVELILFSESPVRTRTGRGKPAPRIMSVGNQQKWDTFGKERSGGCGSIVGHPALPVVAFAPL